MIGQTISHYKILEKLGEGGMGMVYKAEDTKLRRYVALKFLPPALSSEPGAKERFIQEAQAASALDDSHICTIHEIGDTEDGRIFIAMACYTGETLKEKIARGPLAVDEAVDIAEQIAKGLSKAHKKGIVHRDIKPANILITDDGEVKIVDFGLAKLAGQVRLTKTGTTVGTVAYMSPEQARGEDVDRRADIWSLGVVLYEMLTGQLPFQGDHEQAVIYSIVHHEPVPMSELRSDIPIGLNEVVTRALQKERSGRYDGLSAFAKDLRRVDDAREGAVSKRPGRRFRKVALYAVLSAAVVIALVALNRFLRPEGSRREPPAYKQVTFTGDVRYPELSPDGKYVAWSSEKSDNTFAIFVKDLETGSAIEIFAAPRCWLERWSPDGTRLLVAALYGDGIRDGINIVPRLGGEPRKILDSPWAWATWSPDGRRVAYVNVERSELNILDLSTGSSQAFDLGIEIGEIMDVDWSTAHDLLLFQVDDKRSQSFWTIKPNGSDRSVLMKVDYDPNGLILNPRWSPLGDAVYFFQYRVRGQAVMDLKKIPVDPKSARPKGDPVLVLNGLLAGDRGFSLSSDGMNLLYEQQTRYSNLWLAMVEGEGENRRVERKQLTTGTTWKSQAEISPDGRRIAFAMSSGEASNIYVMTLPGGAGGSERVAPPKQLTFFSSMCDVPVWSPDGKEIAFYSSQGGTPCLWHVKSDGGTPEPFENTGFELWLGDYLEWAPGTKILQRSTTIRDFNVYDPGTGEHVPLVADSTGYVFGPTWSPDGEKIAFFWNREDAVPKTMGAWEKDMADGSMREIAKGMFNPIAWVDDGEYTWAVKYEADGGWSDTLFKLPVKGGDPIPWIQLPIRDIVGYFSMTQDGRKFVYAEEKRHADAWIIENFDPDVRLP